MFFNSIFNPNAGSPSAFTSPGQNPQALAALMQMMGGAGGQGLGAPASAVGPMGAPQSMNQPMGGGGMDPQRMQQIMQMMQQARPAAPQMPMGGGMGGPPPGTTMGMQPPGGPMPPQGAPGMPPGGPQSGGGNPDIQKLLMMLGGGMAGGMGGGGMGGGLMGLLPGLMR